MLCGLWKVSRKASITCNSYMSVTSQAAPAVLSGLSSIFAVAVNFRALKCGITIVLNETGSIFLHVQKTGPDILRWAKIHLWLVQTIQPVRITVNAYRHMWGMCGMTSTGKGKAGHFTHSRTDRCRPDVVGVAGLQYLTFFRETQAFVCHVHSVRLMIPLAVASLCP